ncbi:MULTISPECIES: apoptosis inducing factor family protein [Pseudomonas]|uniref:apoptosis inducing factor family protein n=1 Tax=Pseudomonas TaxID=286 RepID=UPI000482246D|nr:MULTISPECIES: apoptosis inducing factor family protein [Pseudomonas]AOS40104.1 pyridine nucleotide-disulfide oxidoreductase [Pseudomonas brassicacearum]PJH85448.1 pyridine nucleotide-disulfide oxidoreductase [Pseudomonas sp. WCS365]UII15456.1 3-phenylpropionate/cinnamic acid dioxygenase ferredoxin--NAD(+) reductase component [Pseudomonas brassicacearum]
MSLHQVARFADVREDRGLEVKINDTSILLLRSGDQVRAFQGKCPHAGAPLAKGAVCHGRLICPWHKAAFRAEDGALCEPPALDSLARYHVEVREGDVWVDDQPLPTDKVPPADDARTFVIIGAGAAGTACAAALREKGFGGRILMIDREAEAGYDRTVLSKYVLAGDMAVNETSPLRDETYFTQQRIERLHGEVTHLDPDARHIQLADGRSLDYDAALIATGGVPKMPALPGIDLPQVFVLRSIAHARQILDTVRPRQQAVIIGDSFIAMEVASSLRKRELNVTVLARHPVPFAAQLGESVGQAILARHRANGVVYRSDSEAAQIEGAGKVEAVVLDNGQRVAADLVIIGVGVRPATEPFAALPREQDQSLSVDAGMRVTDGLWAVGDIATFPLNGQPQRIEHWRLAQQQARIAAANMLGGDEHYLDVPFFWTYHFGKRYDYLGHAEHWDEVEFKGTPEHPPFIALLGKDGLVAAAVACDEGRAMAALAQRMKQPLPVDEAWRLIRDFSS